MIEFVIHASWSDCYTAHTDFQDSERVIILSSGRVSNSPVCSVLLVSATTSLLAPLASWLVLFVDDRELSLLTEVVRVMASCGRLRGLGMQEW